MLRQSLNTHPHLASDISTDGEPTCCLLSPAERVGFLLHRRTRGRRMGRRWVGIQEAPARLMCVDKHQWHLSPHGIRPGGYRTCITSPQTGPQGGPRSGKTSLNHVQVALLSAAHTETSQTGTKLQLPPSPLERGTPRDSKTAMGCLKQRGMAGQGGGDKEGEVERETTKDIQIFLLLLTSLNNKEVSGFCSSKIYLCLPGS